MYIYFNKIEAFRETFTESGFKFLKFLRFRVFILLLGVKMLEENGIRVQFSCYKKHKESP